MIHRSDDVQVAVGGTSVHDLVRHAAAAHPARTALIDGPSGASVTYAELQRRVDRITGWLQADGFRRGDVVALCMPNLPPFAAFLLAALSAGGAATTLNPAATERELAAQLSDSGASVVVTIPSLVPTVRGLPVRRVIALGAADGAVGLPELLETDAASRRVEVENDAVALLPYSSGTTGLPKGVMLTHANLVTVCRQLTQALSVRDGDVTVALAPLFHILGVTAELLVPLAAGATVVTQPSFDPLTFLELLQRYRATYVAMPPPVASFMATHPAVEHYDLASLELIACGGAPLPPQTQAALAKRLPRCAVGQGWGLTETAGAISVPRRGEGSRAGTVGRLLANTELRVVDFDGHELPSAASGELLVRGPQVMAGYLGQPDATTAILDDDGWLHTGDLGHVTPDGDIIITGRLKELIKVNAFQVAPAELEALLLAHPAIADAAVVGVPHESTGEVPVAVVVPRDRLLDVDEVKAWLDGQVAPYKRLAAVHVASELPRTPSGKLLRRLLAPVA